MECIKNFHEICTGVYIIEYLVPSRTDVDNDGAMIHFLEIVSWKSEELPKALKGFLNAWFKKI